LLIGVLDGSRTSMFSGMNIPLLFRQPITRRCLIVCGVLTLLLICITVFSAAHGPANIPYGDVARLLLRGVHLPVGLDLPDSDFRIVTAIRLPRILVSALVGAALACAGAIMQGIFHNPLADPGLLGIEAGGGLMAVLTITTGLASGNFWLLPVAAFTGALGAALAVYGLTGMNGRVDNMTLLAGAATSVFLGALTTALLLSTRDYNAVGTALSWLFGSLQGRGWDYFCVAAPPIALTILLTLIYSRDLNLLAMGNDTAQALGVHVAQTRFILLAAASLMTGTAVSIAGGIGFVGLMAPHAVRLVVGPDYRVLTPASALAGAIFLTMVDTAARLIVQPVEVQVGSLTALLGVPFFLIILWRQRRLA
jgi:iron complex transport system permease protein